MTLKKLRNDCNKTLAEVAERLGLSASAVGHYEQGIRRVDLESVLKLADLYGVSAEEIIKAQIASINVSESD